MGVLKNIKKRIGKKVKASSLTEVLTATVIIAVVFGVTVTVLSTILQSITKKDKQFIENEINEIQYLIQHKQLKIPLEDSVNDWNIVVEKEGENSNFIIINASNIKTKKKVQRKLVRNEN